MGQICREGMDECGILPKARYICNDRISLPEVAGCLGGAISPLVGPEQSHGGDPGGEAPGSSSNPAVHSTKKNAHPQKPLFWCIFICVLHTN